MSFRSPMPLCCRLGSGGISGRNNCTDSTVIGSSGTSASMLSNHFQTISINHNANSKPVSTKLSNQRVYCYRSNENRSQQSISSLSNNEQRLEARNNNIIRRMSQLNADEAKVFEKATQIVAKNKSFRPRERAKKGLKNLQSVKTLAGRAQSLGQVGKARKQPLTVTAQFQQSLNSLMITLNQANPFFIRCIKSNSNKVPNSFDEDTVQRQLRYTGMLETVRIRQAGYNVRLSYDEFIQLYRILLPKGLNSTCADVRDFLLTLNLNRDNYQVGSSKIFMRESEKVKLDYRLHQQIMASIVTIQRWFRAKLEREKFLRLRRAAITIQAFWRMSQVLIQKKNFECNASIIQRAWRNYRSGSWFKGMRRSIVVFQAHARGNLARKKFQQQLKVRRNYLMERQKAVSKDSSQEEVEPDESESSGAPNDSESDHDQIKQKSPSDPSNSSSYQQKETTDSRELMPPPAALPRTLVSAESRQRVPPKRYWHTEWRTFSDDSVVLGRERRTVMGNRNGSSVNAVHSDSEMDTNLSNVDKNSRIQADDVDEDDEDVMTNRKKSNVWEVRRGASGDGVSGAPPPPRRHRGIASKSVDSASQSSHYQRPARPANINILDSRRNSDPTSQSGDPSVGPNTANSASNSSVTQYSPSADLLEWKGTTMFTIAGHRFRKVGRFSKEDRCSFCAQPMDAFFTQGHKCSDCKKLFHTKCIQNGGVVQLPCGGGSVRGGSRRNKHSSGRKRPAQSSSGGTAAVLTSSSSLPTPSVTNTSSHHHNHRAKFNLTGTFEFTDSADKIISDIKEFQAMQEFISNKICKIEGEEGEKPSLVDRVFKQALKEFKDNLVATYSVAHKHGPETLNIKYKDLISNFLHVMETVCLLENTKEDFPVTMCVNAFRGFMNEFMTLQRTESDKPKKAKRKKEKKRKTEDPIVHSGHSFVLTIINIPTACEICSSFFMWPIERGLVCQNCKLTCHKKCYTKVVGLCTKELVITKRGPNSVFGVPLDDLATRDGKIPVVMDRLITTIEIYGLYTEGIYRKPGVNSKVQELKARLEEGNLETIQFDKYHVHVLASVLKSFLREMPEPLLTFDHYDDLLRAATLSEDRVMTIYAILNKLPQPNFDLMERLIFHLARVALHEEANRMSANALATVFAPCLLRTNKMVPAQDSLYDIGKQTACIEVIVSEQMRKLRATLIEIDTLDTACHTVSHRLSSIRSSKVVITPEELAACSTAGDEEVILLGHIEEIQKEKALLTSTLPSLTRSPSDDDLLSTDGSLDEVEPTHQPLSRHRVIHKHKKRGSEASVTSAHLISGGVMQMSETSQHAHTSDGNAGGGGSIGGGGSTTQDSSASSADQQTNTIMV